MTVASRSTLAATTIGPGTPARIRVRNVSAFQAVSNAAFLMVAPFLGAFLVRCAPGNVTGRLFIHLSLWLGLGFFVDGVARHAPPLPLTGVIASAAPSLGSLGFVWAESVVAALLTAGIVTSPLGIVSDMFRPLALASLLLLPVASTIAILRNRLYDIDRIAIRTLSCSATEIPAVGSVATIVVSQTVLASFSSGNSVAKVVSTVVVAALSQPLRRRGQGVVDRRFNRSRYDAARTVDRFVEQLRHEVDLGGLSEGLLLAVDWTVRRKAASVWLGGRQA